MADAPQAPTPAAPQADAAPMPDRVPVLDPETKQVIDIPSSEYASAVQAGFTPLSGQQALQADRLEYESSGAGEVAAGAAGYLRGLSGGVSDLALDRSGVLPGQDLKALSEQNPIASGAGHVAGVVGGLVAGGEGAEVLGAGGSALGGIPGVAAKLGDAAVEAIPGLADAAEGGSLLARAASGAVRGAAETPFYGVGDAITEDVFDNKPLTAESLLAEAGKSAILGGATGGAFEGALGLARNALPTALKNAGGWLEKLSTKAEDGATQTPEEIRSAATALTRATEHIDGAVKQLQESDAPEAVRSLLGQSNQAGQAVDSALDGVQSKYVRPQYDATPDLQKLHAHVQDNQEALADFERKFYREYKPAAVRAAIGGEEATGRLQQVADDALSKLPDRDAVETSGAAKKIEQVLQESGIDQAQSKADEFLVLDAAKRKLDAVKPPPGVAPGAMSATERLYYDGIAKARDTIKDALLDRKYFGKAAELQGELNPLDAARRASMKGYKKALLRGAENSDETGFVAATDKIQRYAEGADAGAFKFSDKAKSVQAFSKDAAAFVRRASEIATSPEEKAAAAQLADRLEATPKVAEEAAAGVRKQKALAKSPLEFGGTESRDAGRVLVKLRDAVDAAPNDAERFDVIYKQWQELESAKKLRPGLSELRDKLGSMLSDERLFGPAAKAHAEVASKISAWRAANADLKRELFATRNPEVADEGKVKKLVNRLGRNDPSADPIVRAIEAHDQAANDLIRTAEGQVYNRIGQVTPAAKAGLRGLEESRGAISKAAGSMEQDLSMPSGGVLHGNPLAGWTHVAGIPGVAHVAHMIPGVAPALHIVGAIVKSEVIGRLARYAAKTSEKISRSLDSALSHEVGNAAPPAVATLTEFGQRKRGESSAEAYLRRVAEINDLRQNPDRRAQTLADQTKTIQQHAPGVASQVQQAMVRRDDYLASRVPRDPIPPGATIGPSRPYVPSEPERVQFERIHFAVTHPLSIADDLKAGRVSTDAVEAVKATSPEIYGEMARQLTEKVAALKSPMPFSKRMQISLFLGKPADYSLSMLGRTQSLFASPSPDAQPPSTPVQKSGLNHLKVASRSETLFGGAKDEKD